LLCFDEIVTGFRIALGGCQEYYGVEADIATYGKAVGGDLPIGVVGGTEDVMKVIKGCNGGKPVFMGGTFSANPLVMRIARTVLQHLIENREDIYSYLNENGQYIKNRVNEFCVSNRIPVRIMGIGSMLRIIFTDRLIKSRRDRDKYEVDDTLQKLFYSYLRFEKGVHISSNRIVFLSTAHKKEHIEKIIEAVTEGLKYFAEELKSSRQQH
jgi:glutamate-1-semialdehyde aminotransferase